MMNVPTDKQEQKDGPKTFWYNTYILRLGTLSTCFVISVLATFELGLYLQQGHNSFKKVFYNSHRKNFHKTFTSALNLL